jgi:beta-propeller repeat-containing protein
MTRVSWRRRRVWPDVRIGIPVLAVIALATSNDTGATIGGAFIANTRDGASIPAANERAARDAYGRLPLAFVPNAGQSDPRVRFSAQANGVGFFFTQKEAVFSFAKGKKWVVLRLAFRGANPKARIEGQKRGPGKVNYLLGNDPSKWHSNLPTYRQVIYRDLWPGIDMVFGGGSDGLKYEFVVRPAAKVSDIRLAYRGADRLSLSPAGQLLIETPLGVLRDDRPRSYQVINGKQVAIASRFALHQDTGTYGFALAGYDSRRPLAIDPGLVYSTFLGGSGNDQTALPGSPIAVDGRGAVYLIGNTSSSDFPTTSGAFQRTGRGAFVTKLDASGSTLIYSTFLGGSQGASGAGIAVDEDGNAYVTGDTVSSDFPITPGAFQQAHGGSGASPEDGFVTKLNASGSELLYSSYLGGNNNDLGFDITIDRNGNAFVTGLTRSPNFPTTPSAFQTTHGNCPPVGGLPARDCNLDAFVTKVNASGSALVYSSYLGGGVSADNGTGIDVDQDGSIYVTGISSGVEDWQLGDVFVAVSNRQYKVYSSTGAFKETISDALGASGTTAGCAYNRALGRLYTTSYSSNEVVAYYESPSGGGQPLRHNVAQTINTGAQGAAHPESIAFAANGDFYVGHADGNGDIQRYNGAGTYQQSYDVVGEFRGSAWIDLAADQKTVYYTSGGVQVKRYNVATGTQLPDFATLPDDGAAQAVRLLPPYDGSGGILVGQLTSVKRLNASGTVVQTYGVPGESGWVGLDLDPNGTSFWAGAVFSGNVYRFNISSGAIELGPISVGPPGTATGICAKREPAFPTTPGALQRTMGGIADAFVAKLDPSGSTLVYATYLGGSGNESMGRPSIAVDGSGSAYVTGATDSSDFPTTQTAFQRTFRGGQDAFVTKLNAGGSALDYSTFLSGTESNSGVEGKDIVVDGSGSAYVTGAARTFTFPITPGAFQQANGGDGSSPSDAFVTKFNAIGSDLLYSSYLGGCKAEEGFGIAVDALGTVYVAGITQSPNFPTMGAFQPTFGGILDAFVTKLSLDPVTEPFVSTCGGSGTIVVRKQTLPAGSSQSFAFMTSYGPGFSLSDGQSNTSGPLPAGPYSVSETVVAGWDASASCSDGSPPSNIGLSAGETVTCTFVNTKRGLARVVKTVNGAAPSGGQSFAFELRQGASATSAGTILESKSATAANGGVIDFATTLVRATTYALCETVMPGWMTTLAPPFYVVYNPSGDNSTVCTDFTVQPGETKSFAIDNKPPPGGLARTIGFWKNWASCASSNGKQKPVLDQTLAAADPAGITIGTLTLHSGDCLKAIRLLNKSTIDTGNKMASDPAFNLAAQLLAAKLNVVAGAGTCPAAVNAINNGQALLAATHFNGSTHDKLSPAQATQANSLATTLDRYNNNLLC